MNLKNNYWRSAERLIEISLKTPIELNTEFSKEDKMNKERSYIGHTNKN
jgi:hypothetical protein